MTYKAVLRILLKKNQIFIILA